MTDERDLGAMAREIIDTNLFMTLGTADAEGRPWATPVYFSPADYREFFWISEPGARHSQNVAARPEVSIVIFDSTVLPGGARAVYVEAEAIELTDEPDFERGLELYNSRFPDPDAYNLRPFAGDELRAPDTHRLYRATASAHFVLDPDGHPDGHAGDYRAPVEL
jgi:uncharacterized protein YhbP (UPF0306 family)